MLRRALIMEKSKSLSTGILEFAVAGFEHRPRAAWGRVGARLADADGVAASASFGGAELGGLRFDAGG